MAKKRKKFRCGFCGLIRRVRTFPRSACWCRTDYPNRHMYTKYIIKNFLNWTWEHIQLILIDEWKEIK